MTSTSKIFVGFCGFLLLLAAAFLLPRLAAGNESGLAGGATAALVFLACLGVAAVVGVVLLVIALAHRSTLPTGAKVAGFLPLPLLAVALGVVVVLALRKQAERQAQEPPPKTLTPTAPVATP
jgi:hypothetical protein